MVVKSYGRKALFRGLASWLGAFRRAGRGRAPGRRAAPVRGDAQQQHVFALHFAGQRHGNVAQHGKLGFTGAVGARDRRELPVCRANCRFTYSGEDERLARLLQRPQRGGIAAL